MNIFEKIAEELAKEALKRDPDLITMNHCGKCDYHYPNFETHVCAIPITKVLGVSSEHVKNAKNFPINLLHNN